MIVATEIRTTHWKHFQARALEWLNAGILICWGLYLLLHPGMFSDPRVSAMWTGLGTIAAQPTWGVVALIGGGVRASALYVNGRSKRTPLIRLIASFFSAFILTQITMGLFNSDTPNTGVIVYSALVLADLYSAFRSSADAMFVAQHGKDQSEPSRAVSAATHS